MLTPQDRRLLLDALRPPDGYAFDFALGTSYSLDLLALLTAPLAFTFFDWQDADGRLNPDPLALLEALRRHADRVTVFCQAGQIQVPRQHRILFGYLEDSVYELAPPGRGTFHAKFWALRFVAAGEPVRYRILCLSRNLTFDRSWDTALVLEGTCVERKNAYSHNHPLGDFVAALPGMAVREVSTGVRERVATCAHELRRLDVELPDGFESHVYWPLGHRDKSVWPFPGRCERLLVVSPFLSEECLGSLAQSADEAILISRLDSLDALAPGTLDGFGAVYALNPSADAEEPPEADGGAETGDETAERPDEMPVSGLHAKLFIAERGWNASVFTGSANATDAAFGRNVEFLVELVGKKSKVGIDAFLQKSEGVLSFFDLLQLYVPSGAAAEVDADQRQLEDAAENAWRLLAGCRMSARVSPLEGADLYGVTLEPDAGTFPLPPAGVRVRCWPTTRRDVDALPVGGGEAYPHFSPLSFEALTAFFAFQVLAEDGPRRVDVRFVLNVPLVGAPADRRERILRSLLSNREQVLRFLMFLLSEAGSAANLPDLAAALPGAWTPFSAGGGVALFEALLRTLERRPEKLDQVARLVDDLRGPQGDAGLLPDGFDEVWGPIWAARRRIAQ